VGVCTLFDIPYESSAYDTTVFLRGTHSHAHCGHPDSGGVSNASLNSMDFFFDSLFLSFSPIHS
jgi:hypothetical protein